MPRKDAKGKWDLPQTVDEWYQKEDPWNVRNDTAEKLKAQALFDIMDTYEWGLDLACGEGYWTSLFALKCKHMIGTDISYNAIKRAQKYHVQWYQNVIEGITFFVSDMSSVSGTHAFDVVIMMDALYYIRPEKWQDVARNVYSQLKEGGTFIICNGQYFDEADIKEIFKEIEWEKTIVNLFKPRSHCEYYVLMKGVYIPERREIMRDRPPVGSGLDKAKYWLGFDKGYDYNKLKRDYGVPDKKVD